MKNNIKHKSYAVEVKEGKRYFWCSCGLSENQPFCDGSHKTTGYSSIPYKADKDKTVYFCGCKQSSNKPICDSDHSCAI